MGAMIPWHSYLIFLSIYTAGAAMPGPVAMAISARALGSGFRATLPMVLGTAVGDLVMLTLSVMGLAFIAQAMGEMFLIVKLSGAAYLVYLGYNYWTAPVEMAPAAPDATRGFLAQMALMIGNPKTIAFWVAVVPTFIDARGLGPAGFLQLAAACFTVTPLMMLLYAGLAARVRGFLSSVKARRRVNKGAAVVMAGAGVGVAVS